MTKKDLQKELKSSIAVLKATGMIEREAMDFIENAVKEKLERMEEHLHVKRKDYIKALDERSKRMDDADFGRFIKKTLWTVTEK